MPFSFKRTILFTLTMLVLVFQTLVCLGDFEVSCTSLPGGWTEGEKRTGAFSASRRGESPQIWGQISVTGSTPMTQELAKDSVPPHPDNAVISWETTKFQGRPAIIYHMREDSDLPNLQGSLIEFDRYFIQLEGETWARIDLDRSCSKGRAVMQDGSEIPSGTVPMPYEVKMVGVNAEPVVSQIKAQQMQILNSLVFKVAGGSEPAKPSSPDEIPWGVVIGVGAAAAVVSAAAAAAAAIKAAAKKKQLKAKETSPTNKADTKEKKSEKKQKIAYVLQLSSDNLKITRDAPAVLTARVWRVDLQTQSYQPAVDAAIEVIPPAAVPALKLSGRPSPGRMDCSLQLEGPPKIGEATLPVRAQAGGSSHNAEVHLTFDAAITMEFF
jgi:hypothetical protein